MSDRRVEDAELPPEATSDTAGFKAAELPACIPLEKVMNNIKQNLDVKTSEHARNVWFKDFKSTPSKNVMSDFFWFCICWYFQSGKHLDVEKRLFDRISANFVFLFEAVAPARKDFFFSCYADATAQAVFYAMYFAFPTSRVKIFSDKFRRDLVIRMSYWTTGICPEFVDTSHWKLNVGGGGDVLKATRSCVNQRATGDGATALGGGGGNSTPTRAGSSATVGAASGSVNATSQPILIQLNSDPLAGRRASLAQRAPRPLQKLRYSPLVAHFLKSRKFSSVNLVRPTRMGITVAEERSNLMDMKHAMLVERASQARETCDRTNAEYNDMCAEVKRQEHQRQVQAQTAKKRLEIRRKEVLRSDSHEYANYLVSLHMLQQGLGQNA